MIYLIHGRAELLRSEVLARVRKQVSDDPGLADLNTVALDGRQATLNDLQFACGALPFLAERRLVIVDHLIARLAGSGRSRAKAGDGPTGTPAGAPAGTPGGAAADEDTTGAPGGAGGQALVKSVVSFLDQVPETTDLVLVEEELVSGGNVWRRLLELQREGRAAIEACENPKRADLPGWIRTRATKRKVQLDPTALADLAEFVGDDLRQLDQELIKLADFTAGQRPVTRADVRRLVPATRVANVFDLVEALGTGNGMAAGRLLQHALDIDGEEPLRLLALIARQYRLLIEAKALQAQGLKLPDVARQLGVADWSARKLLDHAGRQNLTRLAQALERILAADESIKTGKCSDREAMDVLLAELTA